MHHTKTLTAVFAHIQKPIDDMLETGLFLEPQYEGGMVTAPQIRKVARDVAKEMKRPFIQGGEQFSTGTHIQDAANGRYKWQRYPKPLWSKAYITIPKRKYLSVLINPLELGAIAERNATVTTKIMSRHDATYWHYDIMDREIWNDYYTALQTNPAFRKAMKLPTLLSSN
jgi:hypothetical protein